MSIWYDGTNLNMYRGDSGSLIFTGLPACNGYRVYFSVKSIKSDEIVFEVSADPENYYVDNEGKVIEKEEGETDEEYIIRCELLVKEGEAVKYAKCKIFISPDDTERLFVLKNEKNNEYYYGLKMCFAGTGVENTLIPLTKYDEETKKYIFLDPPKLIVMPKYTDGLKGCDCYDELEIATQNPKDYGIQPLLTQTDTIFIDEINRIGIQPYVVYKINRIDETADLVEELNERVDDMDDKVTTLNTTVASHATSINNINTTLDNHQSELNSHSTKIRTLEQTVGNSRSGLVKKVNDINTTISNYGDSVNHNASDFQATLTTGMGINITNNKISVNLGIEQLNNVLIEDLQDGDILMYSQALGKWINRQLP